MLHSRIIRKHSVASALTVVILTSVLVASLGVFATNATATCNGYDLTLTFYPFDSKAQIQFNGATYSYGGSVQFCTTTGARYSILVVNLASGYAFYFWTASSGAQFTDQYAPASAFIAPPSTMPLSVSIELVLNWPGSLPIYNEFGGYVKSSSTINAVTGRFTVPSFTYTSGTSLDNEVGFGVGFGGINGPGNGWWTILVVDVPSSGSPTFTAQEWVEPGYGSRLAAGFQVSSQSMSQVAAGHVIDIGILYTPSTGAVQDYVCDRTAGGCSAGYGSNNFSPADLTTAEWLGVALRDCYAFDAPPIVCHAVPSFSPVVFTVPAPDNAWSQYAPSLSGGLLHVDGTGVSQSIFNLRPGYVSGSSSFAIGYSSGDSTPPTGPGTPTWTPGDENDLAFSLTWTAATDSGSGIREYELQQNESGIAWTTLSSTVTTTSYLVSGVTRGNTYSYRVRAQDGDWNWGPFSSTSAPVTIPYVLTIYSGTGGTTSPAPGTYYYAPGSGAVVTANPSGGYLFDYWVLDSTSYTTSPITVSMASSHSLTAYFRAGPSYYTLTISVNDASRGTTNPSPGTYTYPPGTDVTVFANPSGCAFLKWWVLDGTHYFDDPITVTMNQDHSLTAVFGIPPGGC